MRHPTRKAIDRLNSLLGLKEDAWMQDWDIELADPARVQEFCSIYRTQIVDEDEKFTLMKLIVASYDDYLRGPGHNLAIWGQIAELLKADIALHWDTIEYWAIPEAEEIDGCFELTPYIREVWQLGRGGRT